MSITLHINSLPDLVLRRIFSKVPLRDLLNGRRVCLLWNSYCIETCQQVRSLALLIGSSSAQSLITKSCFTLKYRDLLLKEDGSRMYSSQYLSKHFHLTNFGSFSPEYATQLVDIFPCITRLEISIKVDSFWKDILQPVVTLLINWSPTLKSLKMFFRQNETFSRTRHRSLLFILVETKEGKIVNLLKVINSLSSLEHLTLNYNGAFFPNSPFDISILGQLREFYLESYDNNSSLVKSLQQYAVANDELKQIGLELFSTINDPLTNTLYKINCISPTFYQKFPPLQNKVAYLLPYFYSAYLMNNLLSDVSAFTSLTLLRLKLYLDENIFTGLLNSLAPLKQLTHLQLYLPHLYFSYLRSQQNKLYQVRPKRCPIAAQLASIQVLSLQNFECHNYLGHFESPKPNWSHLFPNVQVIELIVNYDIYKPKPADDEAIRKSLTTFVNCPKLSHFNTKETEIAPVGLVESKLREWIVKPSRDRMIIIEAKK